MDVLAYDNDDCCWFCGPLISYDEINNSHEALRAIRGAHIIIIICMSARRRRQRRVAQQMRGSS